MGIGAHGFAPAHAAWLKPRQRQQGTQDDSDDYTKTQDGCFAMAVMFREVVQQVAIPEHLSIVKGKLIHAVSASVNKDRRWAINNLAAM